MEKIAIIGAGRMGGLLSRKLTSYYDIILVEKDLRQGGLLAKEIDGIATSEYSILSEVDYIITALPAGVIPNIVDELEKYIRKDHILINISTNTSMTVFDQLKGKCNLASAKIIGHARQIGANELPLILINSDDLDIKNKVALIFGRVGSVCFGDEQLVSKINNIASEEGVRAAISIRQKLEDLKVPDEYISFAIRNVACGTMNAYVLGDAGHFVQKIIQKMKNEDKD